MDDAAQARMYDGLVYLADSLVAGSDAVDLSDRLLATCLEVTSAQAGGIMLDDSRGVLQVLAASSEDTMMLELLELHSNQGPCVDAFASSLPVAVNDLSATSRWPRFATAALAQHFHSVYAVPLRLRERTVGTLDLFCHARSGLTESEIKRARILANMGAIGLITQRTVREQETVAEQLQTALESRVIIEQAKGVIAERSRLSMGVAFERLRLTARSTRRPLRDVADDVVHDRILLANASRESSGPENRSAP